jgi:hypothetical protein
MFTVNNNNIKQYYTKPKWSDFMANNICEVCGKEFDRTSNRQKHCKECQRELRLERNRIRMIKNRANDASKDKIRPNLAPHVPKSTNGKVDFEAEARKIKNEMRRTYRNYGSSSYSMDNISARDIAIEDFTYDQRSEDWRGSVTRFFNGKNEKRRDR